MNLSINHLRKYGLESITSVLVFYFILFGRHEVTNEKTNYKNNYLKS